MNHVQDITYLNLALGYLLLIIPITIFWYYKTNLVKATLWASLRMTIQLLLVGFYLEYIFKLNNVWVNLLWVLVMLIITAFTIIKRSELSYKVFIFPIFTAVIVSVGIVEFYFLFIVIGLKNMLDVRYFIPITGMILGNCLSTNIISLNTFYKSLQKDVIHYRFMLANGATRNEALSPFIKEALKKSANPTIATIAVLGLISLPGMMTGQILGGSAPSVAIKYQIMIMITIITSTIITSFLTIYIANRYVIDDFNNLKSGINK